MKSTLVFQLLSATLIALLLAACGGGGGSAAVSAPGAGRVWGVALAIDVVGNDVDDPQIAVGANGIAIAVWEQEDTTGTGNEDIWVSHYDATTGNWSAARTIDTGVGSAGNPQIAIDAAGNAIAVWEQGNPITGFIDIWANRYVVATGAWDTAALLEVNNAGNALDPQIVVDAAGNAIAVWAQFFNTEHNIRTARYSAGSGWSPAEAIDNNSGDALDPQIAMDTAGNAIAVWKQHDGTRFNIWANRYDLLSGWGTTADEIETNDGNAFDPQISVNAAGNAFAVWHQLHPITGISSVFANRYEAGAWDTAITIETSSTDADFPQVTMDTAGNAIAVWQQSDGIRDIIWANRYDAVSRVWGIPESIVADLVNEAEDSRIAMDASGNAIAVWEQDNGTGIEDIWTNRYTAGAWGTAERIETGAGDAYDPQIGVDVNGNAIVVWEQDNPSTGVDDVMANTYR